VIRYRLSPADLSQVRFAFSPLWEAVISLGCMRKAHPSEVHEPFLRESRRAVAHLDLAPLDALLSAPRVMPDFLLPPPIAPAARFADELERVRATPEAVVDAELAVLFPQGLPEVLAREPTAALLERACDLLAAYWHAALAAHWPRLHALLENDVLYRARTLALHGPEALFADLHPAVRLRGNMLELDKEFDAVVDAAGRGVLLLPVAFAHPGTVVTTEQPLQPTVAYGPRGIAGLWRSDAVAVDGVLRAFVGPGRAAVLQSLPGPRSTGELAGTLGVTASAVSQHLGHLRRLGLVEPQRLGRRVYYRRSVRGEELLQLLGTDA
jgi:DNA-binding transcriptional ArsR family regulator